MKRLVLTLVAGAFGTLLVLPMAHAQSWEDMNSDANSIRRDNAGIRHDRQEQREDLERGDIGAAAREQSEIEQRREHKRAMKEDLNNDMANRYYRDRYHNDDD
jgi:Ni/Co efflux regulator RcnB